MTAFELRYDPVGFPMVRVGNTGSFLHWLPVTKIQFEHFLCDAPDRSFNQEWYEEVRNLNPRVTPTKVSPANYWNAFLSGVLPAEAQRFAFWCGGGYRLPSAEEWSQAYQALVAQPALDLEEIDWLPGLPARARDLIVRLEAAAAEAARQMGYERRLADQMLMRLGVLEWVSVEDCWGAMGEPFPGFCGNLLAPETGQAVLPRQPDLVRLPCFGFRLFFCEDTMDDDPGSEEPEPERGS